MGERLVERQLRRLDARLATLWRERGERYEQLVADIARRSEVPDAAPPHVLGLRPPAGTPVVSQLERRPDVLRAAAEHAERLVEAALGAAVAGAAQPHAAR
jgi:hypothetical protein